jgi:ubiquinone/menaquinone biosynthesis C-methylase UbiE
MEAPRLSDDVYAAQAVYSKLVLTVYDLAVLGFSNRFLWRCPTSRLLALYNGHVRANHLDVGAGTGFFLDHCTFPGPSPRVALLDLNDNCLRRTATRIARYHPEKIRANVMDAIQYTGRRFDSIGMNYVLHCLPGSMHAKARSLDHLAELLHPGGVVFGATLLSKGVRRSFAARYVMDAYNRQRIFNNRSDSFADLRDALSQRFDRFGLETVGCAALFWGVTA